MNSCNRLASYLPNDLIFLAGSFPRSPWERAYETSCFEIAGSVGTVFVPTRSEQVNSARHKNRTHPA